MSCYRPLYALDFGINSETGKRKIKILPRRFDLSSRKQIEARYGKTSLLALPCGRCVGCQLDHAREWAVRCSLEMKDHLDNMFITLTYDDDNVPLHLQKEHFQKFIKDLRNDGNSIRYFGCGEYGSKTHRPHYHMIIFGFMPSDLKVWSKGLFTSAYLNKIWSKGNVIIAEANYQTAGYVARYCLKKAYTDEKTDEFILMSKKPGIGEKYLREHMDDIKEYDAIFGSFGRAVPPRYFEKLAEKEGINLDDLKASRLEKSRLMTGHQLLDHGFVEEEILYDYNENLKVNQIKSLKRLKI